jgi:hypothetical protein
VDSQDPVAVAAVHAIRTGDATALATLLSQHPGLASEQVRGTRTPLHVAADWPGYFPAGPATVRLLIEDGRTRDNALRRGAPRRQPGTVSRRHHRGVLASLPRRPAPDRRAPSRQRSRP